MGSIILSIAKWVGIVLAGLIAILVIGFVLVPPLTRGFTDRWGATPEEVSAPLPGDDLFPATREVSTKAVTIDAPPATVYALIQQMGQHRAGWYGWDWFYNMTKSSDFVDGHYSTRIVPELQNVKVGDEININDMVSYTVVGRRARAARSCSLPAASTRRSSARRRCPRPGPRTRWRSSCKPTADGGTRLLLRMRADGTETGFARWMWNGPLNFGGALFSHKTLVGIKRTAEALAQ